MSDLSKVPFKPSWERRTYSQLKELVLDLPAVPANAALQLELPDLPEEALTSAPPVAMTLKDVRLDATKEGGLWWREEKTLVVADLHLEKGSSFAERGQLLPPYDTGATLKRLAAVVERLNPSRVISLGDNFHDRGGGKRLPDVYRNQLTNLQKGREWIWITGNHDPEPQANVGGDWFETLSIGPFTFRHEPSNGRTSGELAGHLHPSARVRSRGRGVRRRAFLGCGNRLILPAFGALTAGLDARDPVFQRLFPKSGFRAWLLGDSRLYTVMFKKR